MAAQMLVDVTPAILDTLVDAHVSFGQAMLLVDRYKRGEVGAEEATMDVQLQDMNAAWRRFSILVNSLQLGTDLVKSHITEASQRSSDIQE